MILTVLNAQPEVAAFWGQADYYPCDGSPHFPPHLVGLVSLASTGGGQSREASTREPAVD
jgi:hypothetical protein